MGPFGRSRSPSGADLLLATPGLLLERSPPRPDFKRVEVLRVLAVILLVIIFRRPKSCRRQNLGYDRLVELSRFCEFFFRFFGDLFLLVVGIKDSGPITRPDVGKLAVTLRGINLPPINIQQPRERDARRVVCNLDRFAVFGFFRRDQFVGRFWFSSAAITNDGFESAGGFIESWLNTPKTTAAENSCFNLGR